MREIKFRAWDKERKGMFDVFGFDVNHIRSWLVTDEAKINYAIPPHRRDCVLMQYTGLKDCSGKEIYEGDLMMWMSQDTDDSIMQGLYEIVFKDGSYMAKNCKGFSPLYEDLRISLVVRDDEIFEVIGNIYEHPHLLAMEDKT